MLYKKVNIEDITGLKEWFREHVNKKILEEIIGLGYKYKFESSS